MIDCQGGQITLNGRVIHDDKSDHYGVITVHEALEHSSDVAAVKLALKMGPDNFYKYIREFGFGSRPGVELPGETRGLLRPVNKWGSTSIGSIAIGQEVGVTPLQLVSMVSTIANGGIYLPPHVLMPPQSGAAAAHGQNATEAQPQLKAMPFRQGGEPPNPLPTGAHRVMSELSAAEMRKMMEGVVLYGTGKAAQLNGYSSGGKTGTAQKVDPHTHLYSKTMHVASFAGIAPVNNPVISVAVIIDTPKGASYYGAAVSAPVFAEVAQQVLEYLGVPHDIEIREPKPAKPAKPAHEDDQDNAPDINALFAAVNDLPADDPLRQPAAQPATPQPATPQMETGADGKAGPVTAAQGMVAEAGLDTNLGTNPGTNQAANAAAEPVRASSAPAGPVVVNTDEHKVPELVGLPVRKVIETAALAGLEVQIMGSGTVKEQAPAPGSMVGPGTRILVRCSR
jgi:cell division protein FtsI (penicillin-binding protein 3)